MPPEIGISGHGVEIPNEARQKTWPPCTKSLGTGGVPSSGWPEPSEPTDPVQRDAAKDKGR